MPDIFAELKRRIRGDVLADEFTRALYSTGACLYRVKPRAVVRPKDADDVVEVVRFAAHHSIPVTARGGGTSRTGNELGEGIILDFSKHMNRILEFHREGQWVRVQPGLILTPLNDFLKPHGLFFPPDPSTKDHCTLGGMIANNSSGPQSVKYGTTRRYVESLELVLSNGETMRTGPSPIPPLEGGRTGTLEDAIYPAIPGILDRYREPLGEERPYATKDSSGYHLWDVRKGETMDLTPMLVGSEGTLAIVTEAKLRLLPIPSKRLSGLVYLDDLASVGQATQRILEFGPSMLEIMERQILELARRQKAEMRPYLPEGIEAILFVEFEGEDEDGLRRTFQEVTARLVENERLATDLRIAGTKADMALFSAVRSISGPILNKVKGARKPRAFIEDPAVHPSRLPQYIEGLRQLFRKHQVEASMYGHAGDGNLHSMVFVDLSQPEDVRKMVALSSDVYDLVLELKGTISGEHGDGRLRTHYLPRQYPKLYPAFLQIKRLFDPQNLFNPGVIVEGDSNPLDRCLKFETVRPGSTGSVFEQDSLRAEIDSCSGCGKCRSYCPVARQMLEEWAAGRGKIALVRDLLTGHLPPGILDSRRFKEVMDSCINCKRCLTECPSGVDVPWFALCGRGEYVQRHGEPLNQRLLADTRLLCRTGSALAPLMNLANALAPARFALEKAMGLDRRRQLPAFRRRTLRRMIRKRPRRKADKKIVLFLGCYTNFNDPEGDGLATLDVLEHNGFEILTPDFRCCGIARINAGAGHRVLEEIRFNVRRMASWLDQGLDIVFSEPSCALAVKMEYPKILQREEAGRVSDHCLDIHQFLLALHRQGELNLNLGPLDLSVGYHNPCHLRALGDGKAVMELLRLIPGVRVVEYPDECCGLGGTFGMKKENFDLSMEMGQRLFKEIRDSGVDAVATSCGACQMQILQGTGRKAVHPISLLAKAYKLAGAQRAH